MRAHRRFWGCSPQTLGRVENPAPRKNERPFIFSLLFCLVGNRGLPFPACTFSAAGPGPLCRKTVCPSVIAVSGIDPPQILRPRPAFYGESGSLSLLWGRLPVLFRKRHVLPVAVGRRTRMSTARPCGASAPRSRIYRIQDGFTCPRRLHGLSNAIREGRANFAKNAKFALSYLVSNGQHCFFAARWRELSSKSEIKTPRNLKKLELQRSGNTPTDVGKTSAETDPLP